VLRGVSFERTGGRDWKGKAFNLVMEAGEPGRLETPREQGIPLRRKISEMHQGIRLRGVERPLEHRFEAGNGFERKCKSGESNGNVATHTDVEESSEGASPRALRAERSL
jgi:hypothetical protein